MSDWRVTKAKNIRVGDQIVLPNNGPVRTVTRVGNMHGTVVEITVGAASGIAGPRVLELRAEATLSRRRP
jgi:hypothetical protein